MVERQESWGIAQSRVDGGRAIDVREAAVARGLKGLEWLLDDFYALHTT